MTRAIKITPEGVVTDTEVNLEKLARLFGESAYPEVVHSLQLRDTFTDEHGSVALVVDEEFRKKGLPYNEKASALYVAKAERHLAWIAGDAYIFGEEFTVYGASLMALPERIGVADIEDLIERNLNR